MREDVRRVVEQAFFEALTSLGYTKLKQDNSEWQRHNFHLFIRKKGRTLTLNIHEDIPSSFPPFHKARRKGKSLERELAKIIDIYEEMKLR